jgi:hypothetical protein
MWKHTVGLDRSRMTIWRIRFAFCKTQTGIQIYTLRISHTYYFSTATMVTGKRLSVTVYVPCLSCLILSDYSPILYLSY